MPLKFILLRHAEADHNVAFHTSNNDKMTFFKKELQDSKLTENGKIQAQTVAKEIAEKYAKVVAIWSSSLQRCIQTADEIFEEVNVNEYYINDNLIERQIPGYYFNYRTEKTKLKELYNHINMDYIPEIPGFWTKMENDYVLRSRMYMIIMLLLDLYSGSDGVVIIVSHNDAINTLMGKSLKNAEYVEMTEEEVKKL